VGVGTFFELFSKLWQLSVSKLFSPQPPVPRQTPPGQAASRWLASSRSNMLIEYRFTVESWWRTGGVESTLGIVFETSFTYFERGNQIVIQMLEELSHEKSYCA
jgi:hypothetical protein